MLRRRPVSTPSNAKDTINQRVKEIILKRPCNLLVHNDIRLGLGKSASLRV
jgi:hypothetical protein